MRVGVVGLGVMGRNHARVLDSMKSVERVTLFDQLGANLGMVQGQPVHNQVSKELVADLDYLVVSTPTGTHLDVVRSLAPFGKPLLIEKPIAKSLEEAREIYAVCQLQGIKVAVGFIERFNPAIQRLKRNLDERTLGEIVHISATRVGPFSGRIQDVGVLLDLASHDLDLALWLSESKFRSVSREFYSKLPQQNEDLMVAVGLFDSGALFSSTNNWISPYKERLTKVLCSQGLFVADTLNGDLLIYEGVTWDPSLSSTPFLEPRSSQLTRPQLDKREPLVTEHEAFQEMIRTGHYSDLCTLDQSLELMDVIERLSRG